MTRGKRMQCFSYYPAWTVGQKSKQQMALINQRRMRTGGFGVVGQPFYSIFDH